MDSSCGGEKLFSEQGELWKNISGVLDEMANAESKAEQIVAFAKFLDPQVIAAISNRKQLETNLSTLDNIFNEKVGSTGDSLPSQVQLLDD